MARTIGATLIVTECKICKWSDSMQVTREGDNVRVQLMYKNRQYGWQQLANFLIPKEDYKECRDHMIKVLQEFKDYE